MPVDMGQLHFLRPDPTFAPRPLPIIGTPDQPLRQPQACGAGNGAYGSWPAGSWWLSCWNVDRGSDIRIIKANCDTRRNSRNPTQVRCSVLEGGLGWAD